MIPINDPDFSTLFPGEFPKFPCFREVDTYSYMGVSKNNGTPKSSILIGVSIINHPFWGFSYFWKHPYVFQGDWSNNHPPLGWNDDEQMTPGPWIARMHQLGRPFPKHVCTSRGFRWKNLARVVWYRGWSSLPSYMGITINHFKDPD